MHVIRKRLRGSLWLTGATKEHGLAVLVLELLALRYLAAAAVACFAGTPASRNIIARFLDLDNTAQLGLLLGAGFFLTLAVDGVWRIAELVGWTPDPAALRQGESDHDEAPAADKPHGAVVNFDHSLYRRYIWPVAGVLLGVTVLVTFAALGMNFWAGAGWSGDLASASIIGISIVLGAVIVSSFLLFIARVGAVTAMHGELAELDRTIARAEAAAGRIRQFRERRDASASTAK